MSVLAVMPCGALWGVLRGFIGYCVECCVMGIYGDMGLVVGFVFIITVVIFIFVFKSYRRNIFDIKMISLLPNILTQCQNKTLQFDTMPVLKQLIIQKLLKCTYIKSVTKMYKV